MSSAPVGTSWPLISLMLARQPARQRHAAAADADQRQLLDAAVALEDLVRDPRQRPRRCDRASITTGMAAPPGSEDLRN